QSAVANHVATVTAVANAARTVKRARAGALNQPAVAARVVKQPLQRILTVKALPLRAYRRQLRKPVPMVQQHHAAAAVVVAEAAVGALKRVPASLSRRMSTPAPWRRATPQFQPLQAHKAPLHLQP